jgi:hypothetical protein
MNPIATVTQQRHLKCFGLETFPNLPFNIKYKYSHGKKNYISFDNYISSIVVMSQKTEDRMADQISICRVAPDQISPLVMLRNHEK